MRYLLFVTPALSHCARVLFCGPKYLQRRMTCNGGDLYSVMADLDLPSSSGSPDGSPLDTRSVAEGSVADYSPTSRCVRRVRSLRKFLAYIYL